MHSNFHTKTIHANTFTCIKSLTPFYTHTHGQVCVGWTHVSCCCCRSSSSSARRPNSCQLFLLFFFPPPLRFLLPLAVCVWRRTAPARHRAPKPAWLFSEKWASLLGSSPISAAHPAGGGEERTQAAGRQRARCFPLPPWLFVLWASRPS